MIGIIYEELCVSELISPNQSINQFRIQIKHNRAASVSVQQGRGKKSGPWETEMSRGFSKQMCKRH